jgi:hypothetical protein
VDVRAVREMERSGAIDEQGAPDQPSRAPTASSRPVGTVNFGD